MDDAGMRGPTRIAIVGGGIAGLAAAYDLARQQTLPVAVTIYEGSDYLGGLAAGYKGRVEWDWALEHFYHHLFTNDDAILKLTRELGLEELLEFYRPDTAIFYQGQNYPLDSPARVLRFPHLAIWNRLRMGLAIAYLRYHPQRPWQKFDRQTADGWLERWMGDEAYRMLWQPILEGKFGAHYKDVNLAWFWARVFKRTPRLGYYKGGFQAFIDGLTVAVRGHGVNIHTGAAVEQIEPQPEGGFTLRATGVEAAQYDAVLSTVSPGLMQRLAPALPDGYLGQLQRLRSMGAVVLTVALNRQLMTNGIYWSSIPKREGLPFLALVEHTNMVDKRHYDGDHLIYIGDYLEPDHRYFGMEAEELLAEFMPHLSRFNAEFSPSWVKGAWLHKAKYAQPVPPVGYLEMIPALRTPLPGLYYASMSQVYPWDRGTNYAVEIGRRVAGMVLEDAAQLSEPLAVQPV
jgi:protoporphyrinogen oxidase